MEVGFVLGASAAAGASAFVLLGGELDLASAVTPGRLRRLLRRAVRLLRRAGSTRLALLVLGVAPVRSLAGELAARPLPRALGLGEREVVAALGLALALLVALGGALLGSPVAGIAAGALAAGAALGRQLSRRQRERREIGVAMPGIYRTLSVVLGSGQTLAQAVEYVGSHERGPAAAVFARMSLRLRCGVATEEAVGRLARELSAPGAELLATALVISHRTGSPLRELLTRSARLAERQGEFERMLSVKTAQVRLSVRIVCLLPAVMIGVLAMLSPDFREGLLTPVGLGCVLLAAALDGVALAIIRRLVRGVL